MVMEAMLCYRCAQHPRVSGKLCAVCGGERPERPKPKAVKKIIRRPAPPKTPVSKVVPIRPPPVVLAPKPLEPPPEDKITKFKWAWQIACENTFGESAKPFLLPWKQVTFLSEEVRTSFSLWMSKEDSLYYLTHRDPAWARDRFSHFEMDPGWGRKGVNATAEGLWDARGDSTKEGLMLCHALLAALRGQNSKYHNHEYLCLMDILRDCGLPWLKEAGLSPPWHSNSIEMFPHDRITDTCEYILRAIPFSGQAEQEFRAGSAQRPARYLHELAHLAVAEYALSSIQYELVHVDIISVYSRSNKPPCRSKWQPIYEHATQMGVAVPEADENQSGDQDY